MDLIATARELEAMAQTGLHYAQDEYDRDRYNRLRGIAAEMIAENSNLSAEQIVEWNWNEVVPGIRCFSLRLDFNSFRLVLICLSEIKF